MAQQQQTPSQTPPGETRSDERPVDADQSRPQDSKRDDQSHLGPAGDPVEGPR